MVGPCETFVAVLALVRTDSRVDTEVVLQVVVVHELGVAVEADVGALTCVLPHVDLEFVLSVKRNKTTFSHNILWAERFTHKLQRCTLPI